MEPTVLAIQFLLVVSLPQELCKGGQTHFQGELGQSLWKGTRQLKLHLHHGPESSFRYLGFGRNS